MTTDTREPIEQTIHETAAHRLGVVDTSIVRVVDRDRDPEIAGVWFALSVRLPGEARWTLLGRRRTKQELLTLVSALDPRHVDGKDFRTCQTSTGPVGASLGATGGCQNGKLDK